MATDTMTTLANQFKNVYEPGWYIAYNEEFKGFKLATKKARPFRGGSEIIGIQIGRSKGTGFRNETQGLPTPGGPTPVQGSVPLKRLFHVFEISHDAIERSRGDEAAFKETLGNEILSGFQRMMKLSNFAFYGDGRGVLCTVATGGGGTLSAANTSTLQITVDTTRYCEAGDIVALWTTAGGATVLAKGGQDVSGADMESVQVQSVDSETLLTLVRTRAGDGDATVVAGNVLRLFGDATTSGGVRTDMPYSGLRLLSDDGTLSTSFEGVSRTAYPRWQGKLINVNNDLLKRDHLYKLKDGLKRRSGELADICMWDPSLRREYLAILQPDIRFAPVKDGDVGYEEEALVITLGDRKVKCFEDVDVPYGVAYMFPQELLWYMELTPPELSAETGAVLRQATPYGVGGTGDIFYGYARSKGNFATPKASAFGALTNVSYQTE